MPDSLVNVACACGKKLRVKREAIGKTVRCPACKEPLKVEEDAADSVTPDTDDPFSFLAGGTRKSTAASGTSIPSIVTNQPNKPAAKPKSPTSKPRSIKTASAKTTPAKTTQPKTAQPKSIQTRTAQPKESSTAKPAEIEVKSKTASTNKPSPPRKQPQEEAVSFQALDIAETEKRTGAEQATANTQARPSKTDQPSISDEVASEASAKEMSFQLAEPIASGEATVSSLDEINFNDGVENAPLTDAVTADVSTIKPVSTSNAKNQHTNQAAKPDSSDATLPPSSAMNTPAENPPPENRYPTLELIHTIYKILAYLIIAGSIVGYIGTVSLVFRADVQAGLLALVTMSPILISGVVVGITMLAFSELIRVLLDIQDNTRRTADRP